MSSGSSIPLCSAIWNILSALKVFSVSMKIKRQRVHFYHKDADYARLVRFVLAELIAQGLIREERHEGMDSTYWKTSKARCPEILKYVLPDIDAFVEGI